MGRWHGVAGGKGVRQHRFHPAPGVHHLPPAVKIIGVVARRYADLGSNGYRIIIPPATIQSGKDLLQSPHLPGRPARTAVTGIHLQTGVQPNNPGHRQTVRRPGCINRVNRGVDKKLIRMMADDYQQAVVAGRPQADAAQQQAGYNAALHIPSISRQVDDVRCVDHIGMGYQCIADRR